MIVDRIVFVSQMSGAETFGKLEQIYSPGCTICQAPAASASSTKPWAAMVRRHSYGRPRCGRPRCVQSYVFFSRNKHTVAQAQVPQSRTRGTVRWKRGAIGCLASSATKTIVTYLYCRMQFHVFRPCSNFKHSICRVNGHCL